MFHYSKVYYKIYLIILSLMILESFYFFYFGNSTSIPAFILGIISAIIIISFTIKKNKPEWIINEIKLYILIFITILQLPFYFLASSRISSKKQIYDEFLIKIDSSFFGHIFPKGQLSLYLDENKIFGPSTLYGKIINNILIIFYFSFYIIPYYIIFIVLLKKCIQETIYRYNNQGKRSITFYYSWNKFYFTSSVYILTYILILFINTCVPAISPRIYLKNEYKNEIVYFGINKYISKIKDDNSANSFPSGHVGEVFCFVLPFYMMKYNFIGNIILIISILVCLSTLVLRYHYFFDVFIGISIALISFIICYFIKIIYKDKNQEINEKNNLKELFLIELEIMNN